MSEATPTKEQENALKTAVLRALGGGTSGAMAMVIQVRPPSSRWFMNRIYAFVAYNSFHVIQVGSLMWLRTTMNYQYRYGTSTTQALKTLYKEGGIPRFYRGLIPALAQGPLSRFGDTAANAGVLSYLNSHEYTKELPVAVKTACASLTSASWRVALMPIDAIKTILQVEGKTGLALLMQKVKTNGFSVLFHGTAATFAANMVGHFPWFFTYNWLDHHLPRSNETVHKLARSALMGFCSSVISDTCSNSIRVIKTTKQTSTQAITYPQAVKLIVDKDGYIGLFGRGLKTRILTNGLQVLNKSLNAVLLLCNCFLSNRA